MKIAIIGQQDFGKAVLEAFLARGDDVAAVFCAPEKEGARPDALRSAAHDEVEFAKLAPLARAWTQQVREAFLSGYDAAARNSSLYTALTPGRGLLGLFELEKAFYELRYELSTRPTWAGIPLQGILECSAGHAPAGDSDAKH